MNYTCETTFDEENISWECTVALIQQHGSFYEAVIEGRGSSFHVIAGPHINGMFLCIPNMQIGCELSHLSDVFWNTEQLRLQLNRIDTQTVVTGLSFIPDISSELSDTFF